MAFFKIERYKKSGKKWNEGKKLFVLVYFVDFVESVSSIKRFASTLPFLNNTEHNSKSSHDNNKKKEKRKKKKRKKKKNEKERNKDGKLHCLVSVTPIV